jgi:transposase-like protein
MPRSRAVRVRRSEKQWIEILKRFESSGVGSKEFCRQEGVSPSSFQRWRRRLGSVSAGEFVELVPSSSPTTVMPSWSLDVALPNGVCLRFRG